MPEGSVGARRYVVGLPYFFGAFFFATGFFDGFALPLTPAL